MVIGEGFGLDLGLCERFVEDLVVTIAERDHLDLSFSLENAHHVAAPVARADDAQVDAVIRAEHVVPACGGEIQAGRDSGGLGNEFTTGTVCFGHKYSFLAWSIGLIDSVVGHFQPRVENCPSFAATHSRSMENKKAAGWNDLPPLSCRIFVSRAVRPKGSHCPTGSGDLLEADRRPEVSAIPKYDVQLTASARPGAARFPVIDVLVGFWIILQAWHTLCRLRWSNAGARRAVDLARSRRARSED